jgi:lipopolysaccharide biosynthesis glycosyltransferase
VDRPLSAYRRLESAMTKAEFEALLKLQDRKLMLCDVDVVFHKTITKMYAVDITTKNGYLVMEGPHAKTPAAAVQKTIARYYKP